MYKKNSALLIGLLLSFGISINPAIAQHQQPGGVDTLKSNKEGCDAHHQPKATAKEECHTQHNKAHKEECATRHHPAHAPQAQSKVKDCDSHHKNKEECQTRHAKKDCDSHKNKANKEECKTRHDSHHNKNCDTHKRAHKPQQMRHPSPAKAMQGMHYPADMMLSSPRIDRADSLTLSSEQQQQYQQLTDSLHQHNQQRLNQVQQFSAELRQLYAQAERDPWVIGRTYSKIFELQREMIERIIETENAVNALLTPQQRELLNGTPPPMKTMH